MAAILGYVSSYYGPVMELWKCVAAPMKRQLNYLCCFNSNIHSLREEAKMLEDVAQGLQMRVDRATNNADDIVPQVETWLRNAIAMKDNMRGIEEEVSRVLGGGGSCSPIKARYSLSKRATHMRVAMVELREQCKFDSNISQPTLPSARRALVRSGTTIEFESRRGIEEGIMKALADSNTKTIGIWGMGGVGKTSMADRMMDRARAEHLFDEFVKVVVGHEVDNFKIQLEIAELLCLNLDEKTLSGRANKLRARLSGSSRILITLDDVWQNLALEDLGIPWQIGIKGCTVMITSRNKDVLNAMRVQKICELDILSDNEPWSLFSAEAGPCVHDSQICSIAEEVMKECKGLPLALIIVARALKDENTLRGWRYALQQLKRSNPGDMPNVIEGVYNPLQFSYDLLGNDHARSLMLLCCLFLEDRHIPLDDLTYFAMGLNMFEGVGSLDEARDGIHTLVRRLKYRFLLMKSDDDYHVRMHDVVRDVTIFIATREGKINCSDCEWSSSFLDGRAKSHVGSGLRSLRLLWIDFSVDTEFQFNDSVIEETTSLNVLLISFGPFRSLPNAMLELQNLRTLILYKCKDLETISIVSVLVNLEIFRCYKCPTIQEVPSEIENLIHLRLLQLSKCENLDAVAAGVISKMVKLEELKMVRSFNKWEAKNKRKEVENAKLSELESLYKLTRLDIEVEDSRIAMQPINLGPNITKYDITIGERPKLGPSAKEYDRRITLCLERDITILGKWIHQRVPTVELLCLSGDGSSNLDLARAQNLKSLTLKNCWIIEKLVSVKTRPSKELIVFPLLEYLHLNDLPKLEKICDTDGPIPNGSYDNSFKKLKELRLEDLPLLKQFWRSSYNCLSSIYIEKCGSLRSLASLSTATDCLSQLEKLDISYCETMEQIFLWNNERESDPIVKVFPKLTTLNLSDLPNLAAFCKGIERAEFPVLTYMSIVRCPKLESFVSSREGAGLVEHDSSHLLCTSKVSFSSLDELEIKGCDKTLRLWCYNIRNDSFTGIVKLRIDNCGKIMSLFPFSIAQSLVKLRQLKVRNCDEMIEVIEEEDAENCSRVSRGETKNCSLFPALRYLEMTNLSKLEIFFKRKSTALELPLLESIFIEACPRMKKFSSGFLSTPKLDTFKLDDRVIDSNDVNGALQQQ